MIISINNESISLSAFSRKARITFKEAERIISDFIVLGILKIQQTEENLRYMLDEDFDRDTWENNDFKSS